MLDPYNLTPEVSLNRVRLVSGPRLSLPAHLEGRTAQEVLSAEAVRALAGESTVADGLRLGDISNLRELLQAWLRSGGERERQTAQAVFDEHGSRLAYLIAVLRLGEAAARATRERVG